MFVGRSYELEQLEALYKTERFQCVVIWGRRRVGKTTLINHFVEEKPVIYFTGTESTAKENLENLSRSIAALQDDDFVAPIYPTYEMALEKICQLAQKQRIVLVMDEYPYLAKSYSPISSVLQKYIDLKFKNDSKLFIILCGSSMSFMENQVLGYQSPLYGRRTAQFHIKPFNFFEVQEYFQNFNRYDLATVYGITGGIPQYLAFFDDHLSLKDNIINNFLRQNGYMYEEANNFMKQELREPAIYNAIIKAVATGSSKNSEIVSKVGLESSALANYMDKLIELGIIAKEKPIGNQSARKAIYKVKDGMFRFWYKFIPDNNMLIQRNRSEAAWNNIEKLIPNYMGSVFEDICMDYLWEVYDTLPVFYNEIVRWWGANPKLKREEEIDIVAANDEEAIVCECKWRNELTDVDIIHTLLERAKLLHYKRCYYYVFSKVGFTEGAKAFAAERQDIKLIEFAEMVK